MVRREEGRVNIAFFPPPPCFPPFPCWPALITTSPQMAKPSFLIFLSSSFYPFLLLYHRCGSSSDLPGRPLLHDGRRVLVRPASGPAPGPAVVARVLLVAPVPQRGRPEQEEDGGQRHPRHGHQEEAVAAHAVLRARETAILRRKEWFG